jgi:hypothetical protein
LDRRHAEDVREAEQAPDHPPGTCVAGDRTWEIEVVPCTEPHLMEVVERLADDADDAEGAADPVDGDEPVDEGRRRRAGTTRRAA